MKITLRAAFITAIYMLSTVIYAYDSDTLYFCREYKNGEEIGASDLFASGPGGIMITVMIKTNGGINERSVSVKVEKVLADSMQQISIIKFDVEPQWDYIFFSDIKFPEPGLYHVSLLRADSSEVASNFVTIALKDEKK